MGVVETVEMAFNLMGLYTQGVVVVVFAMVQTSGLGVLEVEAMVMVNLLRLQTRVVVVVVLAAS
jgi:hypothetical protein